MTVTKIPEKTSTEVKRNKHEITTQFAFEDEAKRIAKISDKTARLRALREAEEAKRG
jgi:hypothetical protein